MFFAARHEKEQLHIVIQIVSNIDCSWEHKWDKCYFRKACRAKPVGYSENYVGEENIMFAV